MNPYQELGLDVTADTATVKRAYRKRARETHPDHGGDTAAFQRAKRASLVLLDPTKRAKFDSTGEIDEDAPDNAMSEVLVAVSQLLDAALQQIEQKGLDAAAVNMLAEMRSLAGQAKGNIAQQRASVEKHLKLSQRIEKRFRLKKQIEGGNRMGAIMASRIAAQRATLAKMRSEEEKMDRVVAFLADYDFERDASVAPRRQDFAPMMVGLRF